MTANSWSYWRRFSHWSPDLKNTTLYCGVRRLPRLEDYNLPTVNGRSLNWFRGVAGEEMCQRLLGYLATFVATVIESRKARASQTTELEA